MKTRLDLASHAALIISIISIVGGHRWLFLAAVISAAALWTWRGALDWCDRPPEPERVRIVHPDGTETPCEIAYTGVDKDTGLHEWHVTTRLREGDTLRADIDRATVITAHVDDAVAGAMWTGNGYRMEGK